MMKSKCYVAIAAGTMFLTACHKKDASDGKEHSGTALVTVTTDWSQIGDGITKPSGYRIVMDGKTYTATADKYTFSDLFKPGDYTLFFYNPTDNITVSGTTATVASSGSGINSLPGWFFTGKLNAEVKENADNEFRIVMAQQVRELTLVIEPTGGTSGDIETITGTLSGVAGSYDMAGDTHGKESEVALTFTKDAYGIWIATVRLLGIIGNVQRVEGTITFAGGILDDMALESDLSSILSTFNVYKPSPLKLGLTAEETPSGVIFTAEITDWISIERDEVNAN